MDSAYQPFVPILIAIAAVFYGVFVGRAQGKRLRQTAKWLKIYPRTHHWWTGPVIGVAFFGSIFLYAHVVTG